MKYCTKCSIELAIANQIKTVIRDFQVKKYPKTNTQIFSISLLSVFSAPQWFVYLDNLFLGNPLLGSIPESSKKSILVSATIKRQLLQLLEKYAMRCLNFVQIPHSLLRLKLQALCERYGLQEGTL
ncbi:MAG: hypothetical protein V7K54_16250 [Nostoc sp.]